MDGATIVTLILGALLGFLGSTFGGVLVSRHEARRRARIELLRERLPDIYKSINRVYQVGGIESLYRATRELRDVSLLAGKTEFEIADRLLRIVTDRWPLIQEAMMVTWFDNEGNRYIEDEVVERLSKEDADDAEKYAKTVEELRNHLEAKLKSRLD